MTNEAKINEMAMERLSSGALAPIAQHVAGLMETVQATGADKVEATITFLNDAGGSSDEFEPFITIGVRRIE